MTLATPRYPYDDRRYSETKPDSTDQIRLGGWIEVCVGQWKGGTNQLVLGRVMATIGDSIYLRVVACASHQTGLKKGDVIEVGLQDLFRAPYG